MLCKAHNTYLFVCLFMRGKEETADRGWRNQMKKLIGGIQTTPKKPHTSIIPWVSPRRKGLPAPEMHSFPNLKKSGKEPRIPTFQHLICVFSAVLCDLAVLCCSYTTGYKEEGWRRCLPPPEVLQLVALFPSV